MGERLVQAVTILGDLMPLHPIHHHKGKEGTREVTSHEIENGEHKLWGQADLGLNLVFSDCSAMRPQVNS